MRDRISDQLQYFVWRLFVPNVCDRRLIVLPKPLTFLYYLLRPLRLLGEKLGFVHRPVLGGSSPDDHQRAATVQPDVDQAGIAIASARPRCKCVDVYDLGDELDRMNFQFIKSALCRISADLGIQASTQKLICNCTAQSLVLELNAVSDGI